jgi:transcriptional/translational regulatory protein YebC/TACO1
VVSYPDGCVDVLTAPDQFEAVKTAMTAAGLRPESAEITMRAATDVALQAADAAKMLKLMEMLEDLDDVQNVYSNADISEEVLAKL